MSNWEELESVKRLKYRYLRYLDTKQWESLATLLTDDCTVAYDSGRFACNGRAEIMAFLERSMGTHELLSVHHVHHPEVDLLDAENARGVWYLEDTVFDYRSRVRVDGTAIYADPIARSTARGASRTRVTGASGTARRNWTTAGSWSGAACSTRPSANATPGRSTWRKMRRCLPPGKTDAAAAHASGGERAFPADCGADPAAGHCSDVGARWKRHCCQGSNGAPPPVEFTR